MSRVVGRASLIVAVAALLCACGSVPNLIFEQPDAASDAVQEARPPPPDAEGCPDPGTGAAYTCCGALACSGSCTAATCDMCNNEGCGPGTFCCPKPGNIMCLPMGRSCHF